MQDHSVLITPGQSYTDLTPFNVSPSTKLQIVLNVACPQAESKIATFLSVVHLQ